MLVLLRPVQDECAATEARGLRLGEAQHQLHRDGGIGGAATRAYRQQQWDQVEVSLINLQRMNPDCEAYELYAERVAEFRRKPPPAGWDGAWVFEEK